MKWAKTGLAAKADVRAGAVHADLQDADLWIRLSENKNNVLRGTRAGELVLAGRGDAQLMTSQPARQG